SISFTTQSESVPLVEATRCTAGCPLIFTGALKASETNARTSGRPDASRGAPGLFPLFAPQPLGPGFAPLFADRPCAEGHGLGRVGDVFLVSRAASFRLHKAQPQARMPTQRRRPDREASAPPR